MNVSGILVMTAQAQRDRLPDAIRALDWADVHQSDATGRFIVTIESESSEQGLERLKAIQRMPGVLAAEMIIHCFEDEAAQPAASDAEALAALNRDDLSQRSHYSRLKAWSNF
ncbi:MAG TPA: chaperone NapD [bacterium]|jgi:nitrate reductase NapAB chaperone NapD